MYTRTCTHTLTFATRQPWPVTGRHGVERQSTERRKDATEPERVPRLDLALVHGLAELPAVRIRTARLPPRFELDECPHCHNSGAVREVVPRRTQPDDIAPAWRGEVLEGKVASNNSDTSTGTIFNISKILPSNWKRRAAAATCKRKPSVSK